MSRSGESGVTHRPGAVLTAAAIAFGLVVAGLAGPTWTPALVVSGAGVIGLVIGLTRSDRRITAFATFALLASVLAAGVAGAGPGQLLPALAASLLAWDFAVGALDASRELRGGTVERTEALHVGTATGVAVLTTGVVYGVYRTLAVGYSLVGVGLLVVAAVALGLAARE